MTPQEKDLITQLLSRLPAGNEPKDPEADALIRDGVKQRPDAPYFLVQTVLIQEMALAQAQTRIQELERQVSTAQTTPQQQPTSFLGRAWRGVVAPASAAASGPWGSPAAAAPASPNPVWTQAGAVPPAAMQAGSPMPWGGGGSGFLRQAAMTAAGVAGGALLFQGIQSMFGPHYGNLLGGMPMQPGISETVINNYYDQGGSAPDTRQADFQQASDADPSDASGQDFADSQDFSDDGGNFDV